MTNKKLLEKLQEDMEMRGFSHYTKDSYYRKAKEILEYFGKPMNQVTTKELRDGLSTLFCTIFIRTLFYIQLALNNQVNYVF